MAREAPVAACRGRALGGRIEVAFDGRLWTLLRPESLETLWDAMTEEDFTEDERLPYWVELWPASLVLAEWLTLNRERIAGRVCLDLGCGLGFTTLVAARLGARTMGMDYEREALAYAKKNAFLNGVGGPLWTVMDWRKPALKPGGCDRIWGGDIMYERRFVGPVLDFLEHALAPGGVMWVAEPEREVYGLFRQALMSRGWVSRRVFSRRAEALHAQESLVPVTLWEIARP